MGERRGRREIPITVGIEWRRVIWNRLVGTGKMAGMRLGFNGIAWIWQSCWEGLEAGRDTWVREGPVQTVKGEN
jgi:hypothetical protein